MDDRYIKECWDKITHIQPNLTEEEFVEIITQPNFDIEGYLISKDITKQQNKQMDSWFGKNHREVLKENYEYINSPQYQTDIDNKVELKQKLQGIYKKQRIGVLFGDRYDNRGEMRDYIFNLIKKYGEENIEIVTSVVQYGGSRELKKFVLESCGKVGFCEFPPKHHQSTTFTKNPPYMYGKPYHIMNYKNCFMEVVDYSNGIILFPNSKEELTYKNGNLGRYRKRYEDSNGDKVDYIDDDGFWMDDIKKKCKKMGKPIVIVRE